MSVPVFKELSIEDLRKDYSTRHGFVFKADTKSSDESIEKVCNALIENNITKEMPEFVVRSSDQITVFVYGDDFNSPEFFRRADIISRMMGFQIESLVNALK